MDLALPNLQTFPGGPAGLAVAGAFVVLIAAGGWGAKRSATEHAADQEIERLVGLIAAAIGRYVGGRDLDGKARSEATWWKPGAPLPDQRPGMKVKNLGTQPTENPSRSGRRRAAAVPARAVWRVLVGLGHVLRDWYRWPHGARSAVRLLPIPLAWGFWRHPAGTGIALAALAGAIVITAAAGPCGLGWWRVPATWIAPEIYGPGLWAAVRQVLRLPEEAARDRWLSIPKTSLGAHRRVVLRVPVEWIGAPESVAAIERIFTERVPGEWVAHWERVATEHFVEWTPKPRQTPKPELPTMIPWKSTGDPHSVFVGQAIEGDEIVDVIIQTETATPHWGVAGDTGAGKSTLLYVPVVHVRQNGGLVDVLDTKRNSLKAADGFSGVRIHKTARSCIAAFGEFLTSMMAAEAARESGADENVTKLLVPRTLVIDELPTLIKLAYSWWKYGLKGKGTPPFLDWLGIILLTGRSSDHRVVIGSQQFANKFFGGTMERGQIGERFVIGAQERASYAVAFGQSTPVIQFDTKVKGRGAFSDKSQAPGADYLYVREFQACNITPDVPRLLAECAPAPGWFDRGEMAPWITPEILAEVQETAGTRDFLPGGKYGPASLPVSLTTALGEAGASRRPQDATPQDATPGATAAGLGPDGSGAEQIEDAIPATYSLAEAWEKGILPWKPSTTRKYIARGKDRGIAPPEGITDGQTNFYTEAELRTWLTDWQSWQKRKPNAHRTEDKEEAST